jgi:UPF0716 protein FxsA
MSQPSRLAILLAFVAFPLLEIGVLIRVGQAIGFWRLALLVVVTAILGTLVIRRVGMAMFSQTLDGLEKGRTSLEPVLDGFLQVIAGMLLIFPGLISDVIGISLLVPPVRKALISSGLFKVFGGGVFTSSAAQRDAWGTTRPTERPPHDAASDTEGGVTIEGEYERVSEETVRKQQFLKTGRPTRSS